MIRQPTRKMGPRKNITVRITRDFIRRHVDSDSLKIPQNTVVAGVAPFKNTPQKSLKLNV